MNKLFFMCVFWGLLGNAFSQEIIWSTVANDVRKGGLLINRTDVRNKIGELYEKYNYYYDDTGYDIDYFLQAFGMDFMLAHLPKSAMAMQMNKNGYIQVQVIIFILYTNVRIAGCLIFSDDSRASNAIQTTRENRNTFDALLDSIWVDIDYYPDERKNNNYSLLTLK